MLTLGTLTLTGVWLLAGHALAFLVGIFTSQYIKDTLKGMPSQLRSALKAHEKTALSTLKDAETKVISDTMTKLGIAPPAPKPVAAKPVAPAVGADILAALKGAATAIEGATAKLATPPAAAAPTGAPGASGASGQPSTATS